jgi:hypothetical protein
MLKRRLKYSACDGRIWQLKWTVEMGKSFGDYPTICTGGYDEKLNMSEKAPRIPSVPKTPLRLPTVIIVDERGALRHDGLPACLPLLFSCDPRFLFYWGRHAGPIRSDNLIFFKYYVGGVGGRNAPKE